MNSVYKLVCLMVLISSGNAELGIGVRRRSCLGGPDLIYVSYALKCYKCEAPTDHQCRRGSPQRRAMSCGLEHPEFYYFCLKKIARDKTTKKTKVTYGCELIGRLAVLSIIPQCENRNDTPEEITECKVCVTDLCEFDSNARTRSPDLLALLLSFSVMFTFTKRVLQ